MNNCRPVPNLLSSEAGHLFPDRATVVHHLGGVSVSDMSPTVLADRHKATPPTMITNWETSLAAIVPQINSTTGEY